MTEAPKSVKNPPKYFSYFAAAGTQLVLQHHCISMRKWWQTADQTRMYDSQSIVLVIYHLNENGEEKNHNQRDWVPDNLFPNNLSLRQMQSEKKKKWAGLPFSKKHFSHNLHNFFTHMHGWSFLTVRFGDFHLPWIIYQWRWSPMFKSHWHF